jgi:pimeloyl-ACP methyl ester carboxylesterase
LLLPRLLADRPTTREAYIEVSTAMWRQIGSPGYPVPEATSRTRAGDTFDRGLSGSGVLRHMLAVLTQPNRSAQLRSVTVPTLVIHGMADRMVHVSGGRATSTAVPGSELLLIDGMGHDMPEQLWETYAEAIRRTADRA